MIGYLMPVLSLNNMTPQGLELTRGLKSHSKSNFRQNKSGENAGDQVDTVVVQNHLAADWHHSISCNFHNLSGLDILARELQSGADQRVQEGTHETAQASNQYHKKLAGGKSFIRLSKESVDDSLG